MQTDPTAPKSIAQPPHGPYTYDAGNTRILDAAGNVIAEVWGVPERDRWSWEAAESTGRLLAESWAMLEALRLIVHVQSTFQSDSARVAAYQQAEAVIAKAEGRQP